MPDIQSQILRAALQWPQSTALIVFLFGALCTLQGFRFARSLLTIMCGAGGWVAGLIFARMVGFPPDMAAIGVGLTIAMIAVLRVRFAVILGSMITFAAVGFHLSERFDAQPGADLLCASLGACAGFALFFLCRRDLPVIVTTVPGAALMLLGFLGLADAFMPEMAATFVEWSGNLALIVPVLLLMLCVMGYSVQANARDGDTQTGGGRGWNNIEL